MNKHENMLRTLEAQLDDFEQQAKWIGQKKEDIKKKISDLKNPIYKDLEAGDEFEWIPETLNHPGSTKIYMGDSKYLFIRWDAQVIKLLPHSRGSSNRVKRLRQNALTNI